MMRTTISLVLLVLFTLPGCGAFGFAADVLSPPKLVEARHDLADKPTLIVIDDPTGRVNNETMLRRIAASTRTALEAEEIVTTGFIGQDELASYREELGPAYQATSLAALGLHLGAKQVIHAEITGYQMDMGGGVIQPVITMNIKVIDLDERKRVFPAGIDPDTGIDSGRTVHGLQVRMPTEDLSGRSAARSIAQRTLADQTGRDIGRLFFDWRMPAPGSTLENR